MTITSQAPRFNRRVNNRRTRIPHPHSKIETFCVDGREPPFPFCGNRLQTEALRRTFPQFRNAHSVTEQTNPPPFDGGDIHLPLTQNPPKLDWEISFQVRKTGAALTSAERVPSYGKRQIARKHSRRRAALDPQELYSAILRLRRREKSL